MTLPKNLSADSKRTHHINVYKVGLGLIGRGLSWDILPISWVHKKKFKTLKGSKKAYESDGRMIVNATPGSKLSVFSNFDLEVFLNDKF